MTTIYTPDPCAPPIHVQPAETIRERMYYTAMLKALPWLEKAEGSPSTCQELRDIIKRIKYLTQ